MTTRLTPKEEQAIREFWKGKKYLAYYAHFSLLLAEIDALRDEVAATKAGLVWSDESPTEEGIYWQRDNPQDIKPAPARIIVAPRLDGSIGAWALFPGNEQEIAVEHIGGEWAGPIALPVGSGEKCVFCDGSGKCPECDQGMAWNGNDSCEECHGSGDCAACGGEGEV